jgi:hypothetical protein
MIGLRIYLPSCVPQLLDCAALARHGPDRGNLASRDIAVYFELYFKSINRRAERTLRRCAQKIQKRSFRNDPFTPLGHSRPRE